MFEGFSSRRVTVDRVEIACCVGGSGPPVLRCTVALKPRPTTVDFDHDSADLDRKVACPTLVFYGVAGAMARLFNIPDEWRRRCAHVEEASVPGGHFFVDQFPHDPARILSRFLAQNR